MSEASAFADDHLFSRDRERKSALKENQDSKILVRSSRRSKQSRFCGRVARHVRNPFISAISS